MAKQDNMVRLCGRIVNRYDRKNVIIITLSVVEQTKNGEARVNHPRIYFFMEDNTGADKFLLHDYVSITAHIATPRKFRNTGEEYISQALVGDTIAARKSIYELLNMEGMGRGPLEPQMNEVVFTGILSSIRKTGDRSAQVIVDTINNGHRNSITANIATPDAFKMQIGDKVTVTGKVVTGFYEPQNNRKNNTESESDKDTTDSTAKDTEKKNRVYYQRIIGLSIGKEE